jgi:hypothetical protein
MKEENMSTFTSKLQAMKVIWEGEGHKWDDLYEYPYNDYERANIIERLSKTVDNLEKIID